MISFLSLDWAAKGPLLLGIKCVLAESFERIHRSNLIGMGILPLQYKDGENAETLKLTGFEKFNIKLPSNIGIRQVITVHVSFRTLFYLNFKQIHVSDTLMIVVSSKLIRCLI